jgi:hypothetical protein
LARRLKLCGEFLGIQLEEYLIISKKVGKPWEFYYLECFS